MTFRILPALLAAALVAPACATQNEAKRDRPTENEAQALKSTVQQFHKALRWGEYERAAKIAAESFREKFLGRFEARGEDFDIVDLSVKRIEPRGVEEMLVEVEQKTVGSDMTVEEQRHVEIWQLEDGNWRIQQRLAEPEWEARQEVERDD